MATRALCQSVQNGVMRFVGVGALVQVIRHIYVVCPL